VNLQKYWEQKVTVGKRGKTQTKRKGGETFASYQVRKGGKICTGLAGKRLCERRENV